MILIWLSLANLLYIVNFRPLIIGNEIEIFNEICIYFSSVLLAWFVDVRTPETVQNGVGDCFIYVIGFNAIINIFLTVFDTLKNFFKIYSQKRADNILEKSEQLRVLNRKMIKDKIPEAAKYYEEQIEEENAIAYAKSWSKHRNWLIVKEIHFEDYPEEIEFQKLVKKFNLLEKARI